MVDSKEKSLKDSSVCTRVFLAEIKEGGGEELLQQRLVNVRPKALTPVHTDADL